MKLKNVVKENMIRFKTKNLTESNKQRLTEQEQITLDAIVDAVDAMDKQVVALSQKHKVSIINHIVLHVSKQAARRNTYAGLYLINQKNYDKLKAGGDITQGGGHQYTGELMEFRKSEKALQSMFYRRINASLAKAPQNLKDWWRRGVWPLIMKTPVAGQANVFAAISALGQTE